MHDWKISGTDGLRLIVCDDCFPDLLRDQPTIAQPLDSGTWCAFCPTTLSTLLCEGCGEVIQRPAAAGPDTTTEEASDVDA